MAATYSAKISCTPKHAIPDFPPPGFHIIVPFPSSKIFTDGTTRAEHKKWCVACSTSTAWWKLWYELDLR
jgi:hypothetical protein